MSPSDNRRERDRLIIPGGHFYCVQIGCSMAFRAATLRERTRNRILWREWTARLQNATWHDRMMARKVWPEIARIGSNNDSVHPSAPARKPRPGHHRKAS